MLNHCQFIGNLGRDPEIRSTQSGDKVANLSVAVSETWKDKNTGEKRERTEWVRVVIFGPLAGVAEQYLHKGSKVYLAGKMQTRKWTDQSGAERYSTEIVMQGFDAKLVMLDGRQESGERHESYQGNQGLPAGGGDLDDEIPF